MATRDVVLVDTPAAHVTRLRINRPDKRNAIDHGVRRALLDETRKALADPGCRGIVLGGVDGVFSAGGDLPSMARLSEREARARMRHIHELCRLIAGAPVPVVSAVERIGAGGAVGLALLGDHIVVGEGSRILFPFMQLGLTPDWGILHTLPRRVGLRAARRLLTQNRPIGGAEALEIGLVDELTGDDAVMAAGVAAAAALSELPMGAFAMMKARLSRGDSTLEDDLLREEEDQVRCLLGAEFAEGHAAFSERRRANFLTMQLERR